MRRLPSWAHWEGGMEGRSIVAPPGGFLIRGRRGWLHHRPFFGIRSGTHQFHIKEVNGVLIQTAELVDPIGYINWWTYCGQGHHSASYVALADLDFVCGRCEMEAIAAGLPATGRMSEGVCEARQNLDVILERTG